MIQKIFNFLLILYISSLIIFDMPQTVKYSNIITLILWGVFGLFIILKRENIFYINKMILSYFIFTIFCLASVFWAVNFDYSSEYMFKLLVICINLIVIYNLFRLYNLENTILYGIILGSFYNYLIAFGIIHVNYEIYEFNRFVGSVGNSNKLAIVMLLSIFSSLILLTIIKNNWLKIFFYLNILLASYGIFLSASKKAIILGPILLLATFDKKSFKLKNIFISLVSLITIFIIVSQFIDFTLLSDKLSLLEKRFSGLTGFALGNDFVDYSTKERAMLLVKGFELFQDTPLIGVGIDNFRHFFRLYAHNNYLELLVDIGIIGLVLYYLIYILIIKQLINMNNSYLKKYFIVTIFIFLIMDFTTVTYSVKLIIFTLLYIFYVSEKNEKISFKV